MRNSRMFFFVFIFFLVPLWLTGCGDLVEIQDRDFVLAVGIGYENEQYQVTYSLPDLSKVTDQSAASDQSSLLRTYEGRSLPEIEQIYNFNSESRLDYRHLQVIILESSICSDPQAMNMLLTQINDNYDISHNVLVYYYEADVSELMGTDGVNGSIGEHLKKLNHNNRIHGLEPAKIGSLIDCIANERTLFIPALLHQDNSIAVNGGIFFRENQMLRGITPAESDFYYITMGKSNDYLIRMSANHLLQLKSVKAKSDYELTEQGPVIQLRITGTAQSLPEQNLAAVYPQDKINEFVKTRIEAELNDFMKQDRIDYLNLYEKSSYKSRATWLRYEHRGIEFIDDAEVLVSVDIHYE